MLRHLPPELKNAKYRCTECFSKQHVDWLEETKFPNEGVPRETGEFVLAQVLFTCKKCGKNFGIELPKTRILGYIHLYGDESFRDFSEDGVCLYTYSLVGCDSRVEAEISHRINTVKRTVLPEFEPNSWKIHMTKIWSGQRRQADPFLKFMTSEKIRLLATGISEVLKDERMFKFNTMFIQKKSPDSNLKILDYSRNDTFRFLIINAIHKIIRCQAKPRIFLDSHKETNTSNTKHQWASVEFNKLRHTRLFAYIACGRQIDEPMFIPPASHTLSEISDFISFYVARFHYCKMKNKEPDIDLIDLGPVEYSTYDHLTGDILFKTSEKYPWDIQYPSIK